MPGTKLVSACLMVLLWTSAGRAQDSPDRDTSAPAWEVAPYVGVARHSPAGARLGATPGRNHLFLGAHFTAAVLRWRRLTVAYAPEVVPLLMLSDNPRAKSGEPPILTGPEPQGVLSEEIRSVSGVGASPAGFEGRVDVANRVRLYAATAAGFVVFSVPAPLPDSRRFNYTFEVGGGIDFQIVPRWWLRAGYKFHHFSNGYSAHENPGVDAKVVVVGVSRAIGRP